MLSIIQLSQIQLITNTSADLKSISAGYRISQPVSWLFEWFARKIISQKNELLDSKDGKDSFNSIIIVRAFWQLFWHEDNEHFVDAPSPHTDDSPSGGNLSVNKAAAADTFAL